MVGIDSDKLEQLKTEMQELQQDLHATQMRLQLLADQLHRLQNGTPLPTNDRLQPAKSSSFSLENFIGLRLIHLIGIVVLVIGLSIGVKYAIDQQLISERARIGLAYAAGSLLYGISVRLKKRYTAFSAILFSGAMASLYFTSYGAYVYYHLFPFALVFVLMVGLTFFTVYQALKYDRQEIAVLGLVGAYAIPFLISSNSGRAELLFTYMALINTAVVFLAFKRGWKRVALLAQGITWLLLLGWAGTRFTAAQLTTAYGFAAFFFLLFYAYVLSDKVLRHRMLGRTQAHQIFLNNVLLYILLALVYNTSFPAHPFRLLNVGFSLFAAAQALLCHTLLSGERYLKQGLVLFSIGLLLLFIAAQWEGLTVTLLWLFVALVLFGVGFWTKAMWLRLAAMVFMGLTLAKLVFLDSQHFSTVQKILAYLTLGVLLLVVGFFYQRFKETLFQNKSSDAV